MKVFDFWLLLASSCMISSFYLTNLFQEMAYWTEGMHLYWLGAFGTYAVLGSGLIAWWYSWKRSNTRPVYRVLQGLILLGLLLAFFWTSFVIIAGMSGM